MDNGQTVFVVDDDPGMRNVLCGFLRASGFRFQAFGSAIEFLSAYASDRGGCLVLDLRMPEMSGLELQERLVGLGFSLPIIVVSGNAAVVDAVKAMKLGSYDFIEKPYSSELLLLRIREALDHDRRARTERARKAEAAARLRMLTKREKQVLRHVVSGRQSKAIADEMGLSVSTIDNHRANIMKKLKAETSADLTRIALLIDPLLPDVSL